MNLRERTPRILVLAACLAGATLAALHVRRLESRLARVELTPAADPSEVEAVRRSVEQAERRIVETLARIDELRATEARTAELDRRLETLRDEVRAAALEVARQHARLDQWDGMREELGPGAIDRRMEAYASGAEVRWRGLDETARAAMDLARNARTGLEQVEQELARDPQRMWSELMGPVVQVMGLDTVGSGIILRSDPEAGTGKHRTYVLTSWHVIRELQRSPDDLDFAVPLTIFGTDRRVSPETARVARMDSTLDVALLLLDTTRAIESVARLPSRERLERVRIFDRIYAVGCPLGNDPIPTYGEVADTGHVVDGSPYWMISAPTYIGNSGGGIFDARTHELLAVFSKIYTHGTIRPTVIPHMGLATPMTEVYAWLAREGFAWIETGPDASQAQMASAKR